MTSLGKDDVLFSRTFTRLAPVEKSTWRVSKVPTALRAQRRTATHFMAHAACLTLDHADDVHATPIPCVGASSLLSSLRSCSA